MEKKRQKLSFLAAFAMSLGCIIGCSCFTYPGMSLIPKSGVVGTMVGVLFGGFFALLICVNYITMVKCYPEAGSTFRLIKESLGMDHAYFSVWSLLLAYISIIWTNSLAIGYIGRSLFLLNPERSIHYKVFGQEVYPLDILMSVLILALAGLILSMGYRIAIRAAAAASLVFAVCTVILFAAVLSGAGFSAAITPAFATTTRSSRQLQILAIAVLAPWLFSGFEGVIHMASELRFSALKVFIAAGLSIIAGGFVYVMMTLMANCGIPDGFRSWEDYVAISGTMKSFTEIPVYLSISERMGGIGVIIMLIAFLSAMISSVLGFMMLASRTIRIMAEDNLAPERFLEINEAGVPINAVRLIVAISIPVLFVGMRVVGFAVDITTLAIVIVYAYISFGAFFKAKKGSGLKAAGILGFVLSILIFCANLIPDFIPGSTLAMEDYVILSIWSLVGLICYGYVLNRDRQQRLGKTVILCLAMFFLYLYSATMWTGMIMEKDLSKAEGVSELSAVLRTNNLIHSIVVIIAVFVLFSLFSIMLTRNRELDERITTAQQRDKVRDSMMSNMSHDIRTPMNSIIGFANLALHDSSDSAKMAEYLAKIRTSGSHLLALINDVLEMSRLENGRVKLRQEKINLPILLSYVQRLLNDGESGVTHEFNVNIYHLQNENVICDRDRLRQVLIYLSAISAKYTPEGDKITIGVIQLGNTDYGRGVYEFYVKNGANENAVTLDRTAEETAAEQDTTGPGFDRGDIGYEISSRLINLMGGRIETEKNRQGGTDLYVTLELEPCEEVSDYLNVDQLSVLYGKRALIVDDIMVNRQIASATLRSYGIETEEAHDGAEAVEIMERAFPGHYDFILMDIQMPKLNGFEAAKKIRELQDPINSSVPILALTANIFDEDRDKARISGMNGFIPKPIETGYMMSMIADVLRSEYGEV